MRPSLSSRHTLRRLLAATLIAALSAGCGRQEQAPVSSMILATTTSTQDSGLLDLLVPQFEAAHGVQVKVIAVGTGAALAMAQRGDADAVLVHSPAAEAKAIATGDLVDGRLVMHNDFLLVGPADDPADVKGASELDDAMGRIARAGIFISRGDDSGTHKQELALGQAAGVDVATIAHREETGQGMGATLQVASQRRAYTLTDRGTFLAQRKLAELEPVFSGDRRLLNVYHVHLVNPTKHSGVHEQPARAFADFLVAPATQRTIGEFRRAELGQPLFIPDAGKTEAELGH